MCEPNTWTAGSYLMTLLWLVHCTVSIGQSCTAGYLSSSQSLRSSTSSRSAVYVDANSAYGAQCNGTVYAWHYCYYPTNRPTNLEAAFGMFSVSTRLYSLRQYRLREGSYHLLHLDTQGNSFTCGNVTLNPSQYFQIYSGDRVGACLKKIFYGNTDYLDILFNTHSKNAAVWATDGCTENVMQSSPLQFTSSMRNYNLHLSVDININECAVDEDNCHDTLATCSDVVGGSGSFECTCNTGYTGDGITCNDDDECNSGTDNCAKDATCMNSDGSYTCTCNTGYFGDGFTCDAQFQLQLLGIANCSLWLKTTDRAEAVKQSVEVQVEKECNCTLLNFISNESLHCLSVSNVYFRASVHSTTEASTRELLMHMQRWVQTGKASVNVQEELYEVDDCLGLAQHQYMCGEDSTEKVTENKNNFNIVPVAGGVGAAVIIAIVALAAFTVCIVCRHRKQHGSVHDPVTTQGNRSNVYELNTNITNSMTDNDLYAGLQSSLSATYEYMVVYEEPDKSFPENIRPVPNIAYRKSLNEQRLRPTS